MRIVVEVGPGETFATLRYTWEYGGQPQAGVLLIAGDGTDGEEVGAWTDSWHSSTSVMPLTAAQPAGERVSLRGEYAVEGHPNWGWRIEVELADEGELVLRMFNVEPTGGEEWAVEAKASRA